MLLEGGSDACGITAENREKGRVDMLTLKKSMMQNFGTDKHTNIIINRKSCNSLVGTELRVHQEGISTIY